MKKILVTGGTGFIGSTLIESLLQTEVAITVLSRQNAQAVQKRWARPVNVVSSLSVIPASDVFDGIVNLAGEGIMDGRWTLSRKQALMDSRIALTQSLVCWMETRTTLPKVLISGSAIGYYGSRPLEKQLTENDAPGTDFAAQLCADWEQEARLAEKLGVRTCIVRTGIVLHPKGGALKKMLPLFRLGLGGVIGSGQQIMSWIHLDDMVRLLIFLLEHPQCQGVFNAVAPQPVSNESFTRALGNALKRPTILTMPAKLLQLLLGESSVLVTGGQYVVPEKIVQAGFGFGHQDLQHVFSRWFSPDIS